MSNLDIRHLRLTWPLLAAAVDPGRLQSGVPSTVHIEFRVITNVQRLCGVRTASLNRCVEYLAGGFCRARRYRRDDVVKQVSYTYFLEVRVAVRNRDQHEMLLQ